ncbi:MAG: hypothetical protein L0027_15755, partial [Candidatus Rokubacteria bacterium]|nr:hypothetical protein [Candidatus Rokubacteria bacterium]
MGGGRRSWLLGLAVLAGAVFLLDAWRYAGHQLDDSFITFRYARNLVEGHGLVFNPGEHVEGYTNLLFVLLSAGLIAVGIDPLVGTTIVSALAALTALIATGLLGTEVLRRSGGSATREDSSGGALPALTAGAQRAKGQEPSFSSPAALGSSSGVKAGENREATGTRQAEMEAQRNPGPRLAVLLAVGLLLATEGFAYWSVMSMETMLFTAFLVWGLLLILRGGWTTRGARASGGSVLLAVPFVLMVLTRPEGTAIALLAFVVGALMGRRRGGGRAHLRRLGLAAAIAAVSIVALFAWRFAYYGRLVPNTFHAKVTGDKGQILTGLAYLGDWSLASPLLAASLLAPLALLSARVRERLGRGHPAWLLWVLALFIVASGVALGGDSMPFFRFFVPAMPLLAVVAATGAAAVLQRHQKWLVIAAVPITAVASHVTIQPYRAFVAHRTAVVGAAVGRWFARELASDELMAINTVGALPWESDLPTLDMLGLTDASIAARPVWVASAGWAGHRRGWGAYVMRRRPHAILWYNSAGSTEPFYLGDRELAADPYFRFFYRLRVERLPALDGSTPRVARDAGAVRGTGATGGGA